MVVTGERVESIVQPPRRQILPLITGSIAFNSDAASSFLITTGLSRPEISGCWTIAPEASLTFLLPAEVNDPILLKLEFAAFVRPALLEEQLVKIAVNGHPLAEWRIFEQASRTRVLFIERAILVEGGQVTIDLGIPLCASPASLNLNKDARRLGILLRSLTWQAIQVKPSPQAWVWQLGRPVGGEARKTYDQKIESGFWASFITGPNVLDIGFKGYAAVRNVVPITPTAIGLDLDYPGYDGSTLPFPDESQDAVYSSHCLEHIEDHATALREWHRVTKIGGHVIIVVPHAYLYERKLQLPSKWNRDHKRVYTPASLLHEVDQALEPNAYRVRHLDENDRHYNYDSDPDKHPFGCYEVVLVIQKIRQPSWRVLR